MESLHSCTRSLQPQRAGRAGLSSSLKLSTDSTRVQARHASVRAPVSGADQPFEQPSISDKAQSAISSDNPLLRVISGVLLGALGSLSIYAGGVLFTGPFSC